MTLTTKLLAAAAAAFALLALGFGGYGWHLRSDNAKLSDALKAEQATSAALHQSLSAQQAALTAYKKASAATAVRSDTNQKAITHALQANPDWSDLPVPDAVFDGLYGNRPSHSTQPARPGSAASVPGTGTAK